MTVLAPPEPQRVLVNPPGPEQPPQTPQYPNVHWPVTSRSSSTMSQKISTGWYFFLCTLVGASSGLIYTVFKGDGEPLVASLGFSGIAFAGTFALISWLGDAFKKVGLKGKDISKSDRREL